MSRPPDFFKNARQQPPKGLDSNGMPEARRLENMSVIEGLDDATSAPEVPKGATPAPQPYPSKQQEAAA